MTTPKRLAVAIGLIASLVVLTTGIFVVAFVTRNEPERFDNIREHFKYGSFGSEDRGGIPLEIWQVLPLVFEDLLPDRPGEGYERFGFVYEPDGDRPIGTTIREDPIALVGLNCAVCHTGTLRTELDGQRSVYLGMPAHQFDLQSYARFLFATANDERFTPGVLLDAIEDSGGELSWLDRQFYRHFVIPELERMLRATAEDFAWFDDRPDQGPGRVDTFNPYKVFWNDKFPGSFDMSRDDTIGSADFPSLWLQGPREGMNLHWDGNNESVRERNRSAAIGAGASEPSLEEDQLARIADWIESLPPPDMPFDEIDWSQVPAGKEIYDAQCASCHAFDGNRVGQVIPTSGVGTDPHRTDAFDQKMADFQNMLGNGFPWALSRFKATNGYANSPLDGMWLRAPYLHNGSVPNLFYLLELPEDRPTVFWRGYDVYDFDMVGFVHDGPEAEAEGFRFDTTLPGNGNGGHLYGTEFSRAQKDALIEYLKTL